MAVTLLELADDVLLIILKFHVLSSDSADTVRLVPAIASSDEPEIVRNGRRAVDWGRVHPKLNALHSQVLKTMRVYEYRMCAYNVPDPASIAAHQVKQVRYLRLVVDFGFHGTDTSWGDSRLKARRFAALAKIRDFALHWKHVIDLEIVMAFRRDGESDDVRNERWEIFNDFGRQLRALPPLKRSSIKLIPLIWKEGTPLIDVAPVEYTMYRKGKAWILEDFIDEARSAQESSWLPKLHLAASLGWHLRTLDKTNRALHKRWIPFYNSLGQLQVTEEQLEGLEEMRKINEWRDLTMAKFNGEKARSGQFMVWPTMPDFSPVTQGEMQAMAKKYF